MTAQALGAVTVTPARPLEPSEKLGVSAAELERAEQQVKRCRAALCSTIAEVEPSLSVATVAKMLGVSRQQVYNLLKEADRG